jgi:hypothetical protein
VRRRERVDFKHLERRTNTHPGLNNSVPREHPLRSGLYQTRNLKLSEEKQQSGKHQKKEQRKAMPINSDQNTYRS